MLGKHLSLRGSGQENMYGTEGIVKGGRTRGKATPES